MFQDAEDQSGVILHRELKEINITAESPEIIAVFKVFLILVEGVGNGIRVLLIHIVGQVFNQVNVVGRVGVEKAFVHGY